ncbi:MAG: hypothetical protein HQL07_08655 [Nitrospirae bacterium]|nr:hypothetical protein [Magnetococcales bacterium]
MSGTGAGTWSFRSLLIPRCSWLFRCFAWVVFVSVLQEPSRRKGSVETFVPFYRRRARKPFSHIANLWYPVVVGHFFAPS